MRISFSKVTLTFVCVVIFFTYEMSAGLRFSNRSACIVLQSADSRFRIGNKDSVEGWQQESIIRASGMDNTWLSDNTTYGDGIGDLTPPPHLLYSDSNAINALDDVITNNSNAIVYDYLLKRTHSNAFAYGIKNNSNALIYGLRVNSNAIVYDYLLKRTHSNAFAYGIKYNSNAIIKNTNNISTNTVNIATNSINIATNLASTIANSNAIINHDRNIRYNSNALKYGDRINSNTLAYNFRTNSNALLNIQDASSTLGRYNS
ncbi:MAG: hypothetical protein V1855_02105, partial [bacterium]